MAEVDQKGKAKRLHIKPNIRKALCFPGGSTLMLSHLKKESPVNPANLVAGESVKLGESFGESVYVDCKFSLMFISQSIFSLIGEFFFFIFVTMLHTQVSLPSEVQRTQPPQERNTRKLSLTKLPQLTVSPHLA